MKNNKARLNHNKKERDQQAESEAANFITYRIRPYETMFQIAERHGLTLQQLMRFNNFTPTTPIRPGQVIRIPIIQPIRPPGPEPLPPGTRPPPNRVYVVRRGDTLRSIARRFGVSVENIMFMNNLRRPTIHVGQRLIIPMGITPL